MLAVGSKVDPSWFYPETSEGGYTEVEMLVYDSRKIRVHESCAEIMEDEYNLTSDGKHPIYSKEFLCRVCCRRRCMEITATWRVRPTKSCVHLSLSLKL